MLAPKGGGREIGRIWSGIATAEPVWQLAQWHSRFAFTNFNVTTDALCVSNTAKWLIREPSSGDRPTLTLGVDSRSEYDGQLRRSPSEPWVHLLVQQEIRGAPSLADLASLRLCLDARLRVAETFRPEGYMPSLHAAQFQLVLTLNNTRRGSPGFGDFLWFVVPVYDDRYEVPPEYVAQDFAMTQGKLIYNPGTRALTTNRPRLGEWWQLECELRPWLERALTAAWEKGYLKDSRDRADYRVASLNVGWEVPGLSRAAMDLRGLSLRATTRSEP